jgi:O-antigen/teichoic acid export membrane protein
VGLVVTHNLLLTLAIVSILNLLVAFGFDRIKTGKLENITPLINKRVFQLILTCVPLVIFSFLLSMENLIPKNLLESIYGVEELGIYASIASPTLVVQVVASVVFTPFLPRFTKMYLEGELDVFKRTFHNIILALGALGVIIIVGASILGRLGLRVLFGEMILEYYYLFMPIVLCTLLTAMIWIISSIVIAMRQIEKLLIGIVLDFGLCMCIAKPIIEQYNKNGVSIVQIISYTLLIGYMIIICESSIVYTKHKRGKKL